ncbi:Tetratricopeptide repeat-containing protein [Amycolatopsis pretoriensis]|uniref:Tetratricopeptide repeat-containing protein n=1 Tax=Amycolatopsis pretoriensis TaxID=218821 RepID=A0A1H5QHT5_9PSEU|nr:tetratricopeptide repeat protein [Amycolatopsis pretoriensis]SEF24747.1 Tetratricopeptide repeat-containing protein [Amycolatopsis pretoriensis]
MENKNSSPYNKSLILLRRGLRAQREYELSGNIQELDVAVTNLLEALTLAPSSGIDTTAVLTNAGNALLDRYHALGNRSDLTQSIKFHQRAVTEAPDDGLDRSVLLSNLGAALRVAFDTDGDVNALDEAVGVLRLSVNSIEPSSRSWLLRASNLGSALHARFTCLHDYRDLAEAEGLLTMAEKLSQPGTPDGDAVRANLADILYSIAFVLGDRSRLTDALDMLEEVYLSRRALYGPDHPNTLGSRNNLANAMARAGNYSDAEVAYRSLLEDTERVLGADHPGTLACRNNLASVMGQSDNARALTEFERLLSDQSRVIGDSHPDTVTTRQNLAWLYVRLNEFDRASELATRLLDDHATLYGAESATTMRTRAFCSSIADTISCRSGHTPPDRAVFGIDVALYSTFSDYRKLSAHEEVVQIVRKAFEKSTIQWAHCSVSTMSDSLIVMIPPGFNGVTLFHSLPDLLAIELDRVNHGNPRDYQLRLRVALHSGTAAMADHTSQDNAVTQIERMLSSTQLRAESLRPGASLVMLVSDRTFRQFGSFRWGSQFEEIQVRPAGTGWLRKVAPLALTSGGSPNYPELDDRIMSRLVDALLAIPSMNSATVRQHLFNQVQSPQEWRVHPGHARLRDEVAQLVTLWSSTQNRLDELVATLVSIDGDSLTARQLADAFKHIWPRPKTEPED